MAKNGASELSDNSFRTGMTPEVAELPNMLGPHTSQFWLILSYFRIFLPAADCLAHINTLMSPFCEAFWSPPISKPPSQKKILSLSVSLSVPASIKHVSRCIIITCFKSVSELKVNSSREGCCFITSLCLQGFNKCVPNHKARCINEEMNKVGRC